jgi:hypothetical protein
LQNRPWIGLIGFLVPFLWKPVAHTFTVLMHDALPGPERYPVGAALGLLGFALVWRGFRKDELSATCLGFFGGALIWIGWFEHAFEGFGAFLNVPKVGYLGPNLLMMEASAVLLLAMLIFTGANKDTRCRMFLWFHRHFRLRPNLPTPGYRRQFARIAAMEMVLINWFFYVWIILLIDERLFGLKHPFTYAVTAAMFAWGVYLVAFKMLPYRSVAGAIRYGIPTVGILWHCCEITALWGWYREPWIRPFEFLAGNMLTVAAFLTVFALAATMPMRGASAEVRKT